MSERQPAGDPGLDGNDALFALGALLVAVGAGLVFIPAGIVVAGLVFILAAALGVGRRSV